jgi:ATP dependent DNA ligase domain
VSLVQQFFAISQSLTSFIVDAEIVAINASGDTLKSFQELSNRARKDVKLHEIKVPVCVYAFDLMYLNGQVSALQPNIRDIYIKHNMVINGSHSSKSLFVAGESFSAHTSPQYRRTNPVLLSLTMWKVARVKRAGMQLRNSGSRRSTVGVKV